MPYREADQLNTYLFHEGTAISAYEYMGAHAVTQDGAAGYMYRVWAPRAQAVSWWVTSIPGIRTLIPWKKLPRASGNALFPAARLTMPTNSP